MRPHTAEKCHSVELDLTLLVLQRARPMNIYTSCYVFLESGKCINGRFQVVYFSLLVPEDVATTAVAAADAVA